MGSEILLWLWGRNKRERCSSSDYEETHIHTACLKKLFLCLWGGHKLGYKLMHVICSQNVYVKFQWEPHLLRPQQLRVISSQHHNAKHKWTLVELKFCTVEHEPFKLVRIRRSSRPHQFLESVTYTNGWIVAKGLALPNAQESWELRKLRGQEISQKL